MNWEQSFCGVWHKNILEFPLTGRNTPAKGKQALSYPKKVKKTG